MRWGTPCCYQQQSLWRKNNSSFVELGISRPLGRRGCQDPKEQIEYIGLQCSHDDYSFDEYHEDFEIIWPKDLLGEMKEYRQLSEQNKDQIEVFFVPWDMLGVQRYLSR